MLLRGSTYFIGCMPLKCTAYYIFHLKYSHTKESSRGTSIHLALWECMSKEKDLIRHFLSYSYGLLIGRDRAQYDFSRLLGKLPLWISNILMFEVYLSRTKERCQSFLFNSLHLIFSCVERTYHLLLTINLLVWGVISSALAFAEQRLQELQK